MKNSITKIHLFKMLSSLVVWILVLVSFVAIGFSINETVTILGQEVSSKISFKGWENSSLVDLSNGIYSLKDLSTPNSSFEPLTKGLYSFSVISFVIVLLYFVYNGVIFGFSFKKDNVIKPKTSKWIDAIVWILYAIFAILIIVGASQIKSTYDSIVSQTSELYTISCGSEFYATIVLITVIPCVALIANAIASSKIK